MNEDTFIALLKSSLNKKYPNDNLDDLVNAHIDSLKVLSKLSHSLTESNFELGKKYYDDILPEIFSSYSIPLTQRRNSLFLGLYYFASAQKDSLQSLDCMQARTLDSLLNDFKAIWKEELKFNFSQVFTYIRIWENLKVWINQFDIKTPNSQLNKQNLLYLYFILNLIAMFLPKPLSQADLNNLSWFSIEKRKEEMFNLIRKDSQQLINTIMEKLEILKAETRQEQTQPLIITIDTPSEEEEFFDVWDTEEEEFFDVWNTEEEEFFDTFILTNEQLDEFERGLNNSLQRLKPTHFNIRATTQFITFSNEEQLLQWINTRNPVLLKSVQSAMEHIFTLKENNRDVRAYEEEFTSLVSQLFTELSKNTHTSFKLPKELQTIQNYISQKSNFPTKESTQEIINRVTAFLGKIDSCSFFSLTWLSHLWLYVTSASYRQTYKNIRMTMSSPIDDAEKLTHLESHFKVKNFQEFKSLFTNPERTREIQDNNLATLRGST